VRDQHPSRYGFFATIPSLLDPEAANAEIAYALDVLGADGIILYTRYGDNPPRYLGDSSFRSTWDLLDARRAVVLIHPTSSADKRLVNPSLPQPMIDYPHETTRTACDLITSGTIRSHANVSIILSHGGGTLPYLAFRPAAMIPFLPPANGTGNGDDRDPTEITEDFIEDARTFYFDTALSSSPLQLQLLNQFAKPDHVLYGSDFPYAPRQSISLFNSLASITDGAALKLFPRLRGVVKEAK
jgi:6-methylsalicylate decarboxylase